MKWYVFIIKTGEHYTIGYCQDIVKAIKFYK